MSATTERPLSTLVAFGKGSDAGPQYTGKSVKSLHNLLNRKLDLPSLEKLKVTVEQFPYESEQKEVNADYVAEGGDVITFSEA